LARLEPTNLGSNGKHGNHYTTEVTKVKLLKWCVSLLKYCNQ
jgi:hypothetical protein